jgi:hypothetical protein
MAYTVDSLEIKIQSNASSAASGITKLNTALESLKTACDGANKPLSTLSATLEKITNTFANFSSMIAPVKETTSAIKKLNKAGQDVDGLENLGKALSGLEKVNVNGTALALNAASESVKKLSSGGGYGRGKSDTENLLDKLATKANITRAKFTALSIAVMKVAKSVASCVNSANEYIETVNLFQVAMGGYYDKAFEYAQLVNEKLGIDPSQWMNAQGTFMAMAKGFGVTEKQAYDLSEGLTELSYDISSLYNESVETSITRLQSALAGEIEPIRRLGISISQATLQEYAMAHGINETVSNMTEQEKALLRTMVLMESASKIGAVGDFAKTLESPANALRVLQQQFVQLARAVGNVFIPVLIQIIPVVQAVVSVLTDLINFLARLVGFKMPKWDSNSWSKGLVSGAEDADKALAGAGASAKKLKDYTMGIDELNVINPDSGSGGGGGGAGGVSDWAKDLEIPDLWNKEELAAMETQMSKIKEKLELILPVAVAIGAAFALWKFGPSLLAGLSTLNQALQLLLGKYIVPTNEKVFELTKLLKFVGVAAVIGVLVSRFIDLYKNSETFRTGISRIGEVFKSVFGFGKDILNGVWEVLKGIGEILLHLLPEDLAQSVSEFFSEFDLDAKDLGITIAGLAMLFMPGGKLLGAATLGFEALTVLIRKCGSDSDETFNKQKDTALQAWENIKTGASEKWSKIKQSITDNLDSMKQDGQLYQTNTESSWSTFGETLFASTSEKWGKIKQAISDNLDTMSQDGQLFQTNTDSSWSTFGETIGKKVSDFTDGVKKYFTGMWDSVNDGFNGFLNKVPTVVSNIGKALVNGFKKALNSVIETFETGINDVINGWNALVNIGRAVPGVGEKIANFLTISPIQIPRLQTYANGGYPEHGQMFIARESGPELVGSIGRKTAVANNTQIVDGIASGVYSAVSAAMMESSGGGDGEINASFNIYLSGKQIAAEVEQVNKRKGAKIMTGGAY